MAGAEPLNEDSVPHIVKRWSNKKNIYLVHLKVGKWAEVWSLTQVEHLVLVFLVLRLWQEALSRFYPQTRREEPACKKTRTVSRW